MDPQDPGDPPARRLPCIESHNGHQEGQAPSVGYAAASGTTPSPAQPEKRSDGKDHRAEKPRQASSTRGDSALARTTAPPLTTVLLPGHRPEQKQLLGIWDVEKASPSKHKPPECFTSLDPSLRRVRQVDSKTPTCVDAALPTVSGGGDKANSTTLLLDAFSSSVRAEAETALTPEAEKTSRRKAEHTEPPRQRRPLVEPSRKTSSVVSTRRPSQGAPVLKTREGESTGKLEMTCGRDSGKRLGTSSTVKSEVDDRARTSLLHSVSSRVGTLLGKILGMSSSGQMPKPEFSRLEDATGIGESSRKRKPHSYVSRHTGRGTGVVSKVLPGAKESLLVQPAVQSSSRRSPWNVAIEPVAAREEQPRKSQGVREGVATDREKAQQETGIFKVRSIVPADSTATELSSTGFPLADGHGDVQRQRRQRTLPPPGSIQGSKAAIPHFQAVAVVTTAHESPERRGHGKKKSKERKHRKGHRRDDGDATAGKSKSSSSGRGKRQDRERGRQGDKKPSSRASNGRKRKRKKDDKTEDAADILDEPTQPTAESTYEVGNHQGSREFSFEIAMVPYTHGTLPRPELTRPSKHLLGSEQWRESPASRARGYDSPRSPRSVEAASPASPPSPGSPTSPLSPASPDRRASPAHGDDTSPLIDQETRSEQKARPGRDDSPSRTGESKKKAHEKTSHRKLMSKRRANDLAMESCTKAKNHHRQQRPALLVQRKSRTRRHHTESQGPSVATSSSRSTAPNMARSTSTMTQSMARSTDAMARSTDTMA
ncbi:mucin-12-like [Rhipicephalus sanguineus]|uniref:mucin-12-like n=1 Tax=Rhipicephalus sanguineus TaxID=34632 RepID=UPI00189486A4|nr:mucin-12-like [Rhipicephalus sanguineus]